MSADSSGFSGVVFNYIVRSEGRVDEVLDEAKKAGAKILKPAAKLQWGRVWRFLRGPRRLHLVDRLQRAGKGSALRGVARDGRRRGARRRQAAEGDHRDHGTQ